MIHSYPSIYNLGHRALVDLLSDPVLVQEKVDGSQISFGIVQTEAQQELRVRSKGAELHVLAPDKMFAAGIRAIDAVVGDLRLGWVYRGEYLAKPKHNALAYDRVPRGHIAIFDIDTGGENYLGDAERIAEAERLGFDYVPTLYQGRVTDVAMFRELLDRTSFLGGQKIEGVVIKNYARFGPDKKVLMGKFVSETFKEVHAAEWKVSNPSRSDVVQFLIGRYRTPARWAKAVQHLREAGQIEDSPKDIGLLFREVPDDVRKEAEQDIKDALFAYVWPQIQRGITAGIAEWYKDQLLHKQFEIPA